MGTRTVPHTIIDIPRERLDEAVEVLALAFEDYPITHYFLEGLGERSRPALRAAMRFECEVRLQLGMPLLGSVSEGRIVGVAVATAPEVAPWPTQLTEMFEALIECIGPLGAKRLEEYERLEQSYSPDRPHYYLSLLGVSPDQQGRGHGRALLERVHALSEGHKESIGVYLDTEHPANVPLYERFGYHVVGYETLGDVGVWCMFRPNGSA